MTRGIRGDGRVRVLTEFRGQPPDGFGTDVPPRTRGRRRAAAVARKAPGRRAAKRRASRSRSAGSRVSRAVVKLSTRVVTVDRSWLTRSDWGASPREMRRRSSETRRECPASFCCCVEACPNASSRAEVRSERTWSVASPVTRRASSRAVPATSWAASFAWLATLAVSSFAASWGREPYSGLFVLELPFRSAARPPGTRPCDGSADHSPCDGQLQCKCRTSHNPALMENGKCWFRRFPVPPPAAGPQATVAPNGSGEVGTLPQERGEGLPPTRWRSLKKCAPGGNRTPTS